VDYEFGEAIRLADTMSPRSVAVAVADMVRELGAIPLRVLESAMYAAGYDPLDAMVVGNMVQTTDGFALSAGDLVWIGGAA